MEDTPKKKSRGGWMLLVAIATPLLGGTAYAQEEAPPAGNIKAPSYDEPAADDEGDSERDADRDADPSGDAG